MAGIWATGKIWLKVPETISVVVQGNIPKGVYAKDIILKLLNILKADGASYKSIEFSGTAVSGMDISSRATLCNMAVELERKQASAGLTIRLNNILSRSRKINIHLFA